MMLKIAKRKRKEILKTGAIIKEEGYIRERGWKRKECGFGVTIKHYSGIEIVCVGRNPLRAYKYALKWALLDMGDEVVKYLTQ